ncbi:hypothetical protein [Colwellia sp. 12G3]|uniref:hypothetical protein n=1 Tax=Colwellia sp. 12G3 TaxID=2058299 RepID=UPI000C343FDA|nr:hypothetical protein [Colwellia sp. 12G3]PKI15844.1 hypothetical protein CXF71_12635 [Colwellia sp. 12G3]
MNFLSFFSLVVSMLSLSSVASEQQRAEVDSNNTPVEISADKKADEKKSAWLFTPLISSDPKLSTTIGLMSGYLKAFDKESPDSMFGLIGNYSNTDSYTLVGFGKAYFDKNNQRITAAIVRGEINNDYDDFLGSGYPLKTQDSISVNYANWSYRVYDDWFIGIQGVSTNYAIYSLDDIPSINTNINNYTITNRSNNTTSLEQVAGFTSQGLGINIEFDSRNRPRSATSGQFFKFGNIAYRKSLDGDESFDSYRTQYNYYLGHGDNHVLAINATGQYTSGAPPAAYASISIKGYTSGQYLAPYVSSLQIDERYSFNDKWGMIAYAAVACLHGKTKRESLSCSDSKNIFPSVSLGMSYAIKPDAGVIVRMEGAIGKDDNKGFYMSLGHPF